MDAPSQEDLNALHDVRILWRDSLGDLRKESENVRISNLLHYINTDGLPEQFRRLTSEYLSEMIQLISRRLGATPFNRQLNECTYTIPEQFYAINFSAYDDLRHCPSCMGDIGIKYVNAVHKLVLSLFTCLDSTNTYPLDGNGDEDQLAPNIIKMS